MTDRVRRPDRGDAATAVAPLVVAAIMAARGAADRMALFVAIGMIAAHLLVFAPESIHRARGALLAFARICGHVILATGAAVVYGLFIVPLWLWTRIAHRTPLATDGWHRRDAEALGPPTPTRPFGGAERVGSPRRTRPPTRTSKAFAAIGVVAVLLAVDLSAGAAWRALRPSAPVASRSSTNRADWLTTVDGRTSNERLASEPWGPEYLDALDSLSVDYRPYLVLRADPLVSPSINIDGWTRRSLASSSSKPAPSVWFFGGSATWGLGQRDDHTIASGVARLAASDGLPIEAHNLGQIGWVTQQEVDLYSIEVHRGTISRGSFSVFIDGPNDVAAQAQLLTDGHPPRTPMAVHLDLATAIARSKAASSQPTGPASTTPSLGRDAWDLYRTNSLVAQAWRALAPPPADAAAATCAACRTIWGVDGIDAAAADRAAAVYREQRTRALKISEDGGVEPLFFWQPARRDLTAIRRVGARVGSPTIDLSSTLDATAANYLDAIHFDEAAAQLVAERIYQQLEPRLRAWYADHGS